MYAQINMEGRVVNDPVYRTHKEHEFVTFRFVVNQRLGPQENTAFYSCTGNEYIASRMKKAGVTKGRLLHICGNQTIRNYDQDGVERTSVDVGVLDWHFAGMKPKDNEDTSGNKAVPAAPNKAGTVHPEETIPSGDGPEDDDLPL